MPLIIPLFIPQEGCPHTCVFCNQRHISQKNKFLGPQEVQEEIKHWLALVHKSTDKHVQVAFYGGTFTGLPLARQSELLQAVQPFLAQNLVTSIRLSTRPDTIEPSNLALLKQYGVTCVELGVQSCCDSVLEKSKRGHSLADIRAASRMVRSSGLSLGWQLMLGMPGETFSAIRKTVLEAIIHKPDCVRIYPLLVLRDSPLEAQWRKGLFTPLSLKKAVLYAAYMKSHFDAHKLTIIRIGLQASDGIEQSLLAGPYHPAFGEMVSSRMMLKETRKILADQDASSHCSLTISPKDHSIFIGNRQSNLKRLQALGLNERFSLNFEKNLPRHTLRVGNSSIFTS